MIVVMMMKTTSIWLEDATKEVCPSLNEDIEVDVLIIGGGITGMSTAYHLKDQGLNIALLEQNQIGHGVTSKTTGKLTYFQDGYLKIAKTRGIASAKLYLQSQKDAIKIVKRIIEKEHIECDLTQSKGYLYVHENHEQWKKVKELFGKIELSYKDNVNFPHELKVENGGMIENSYVFHPLKYLNALKECCLKSHVQIYEDTRVLSIKKDTNGYLICTKQHRVYAKKVVVASHYPFFLIPFWMPFKSYLEKSYIMVYHQNDDQTWNAICLDQPIVSHRFHKNYAFFLSHVHKIKDRDAYDDLKKEKQKIEYIWSNKDLMTYDGLPFIGSLNDDNTLFLGTGYNTWGMTNGSLAGKILADLIIQQKNQYQSLFHPKRYMTLMHTKEVGSIMVDNVSAYISSKMNHSSSVRYEKRDGRKVAIYVDENKKEHIVYPTCPHLYCSLMFNEMEKTWDCPCHGSRFDIDGHVIEGPSQYDISYKP